MQEVRCRCVGERGGGVCVGVKKREAGVKKGRGRGRREEMGGEWGMEDSS